MWPIKLKFSWGFFYRLYSLDVQVLENGRICTSFKHVEEPYIKSNTHHFACKFHSEGAEKYIKNNLKN
jgi:hypothetical protein